MIHVKDNIYWLGTRDWQLETFHGHEMTTAHGSSYNSYLIKDSRTALIDTCRATIKEGYLKEIENSTGYDDIDLVVINHSEPDHGGVLHDILDRIGWDKPVYCTEAGRKFLRRFLGRDADFRVVKTGDEISLGSTVLRFIEMKMIHWPDSMMTFAIGQKVLFSNDAFGQHIASGNIFDEDMDECVLFYEALKYYVNILTPYRKLISKKMAEISSMKLDIEYIAPSHGLIWKKHIGKITGLYSSWSDKAQRDHVVIIYDSMYGACRDIAEAIGKGIGGMGINYEIQNISACDTSDLLTGLFFAKGVILGSPTINGSVLPGLTGLLAELKAMRLDGRIGGAFGTYGWSGESCRILDQGLADAGFFVELEPVSVFLKMNGDDEKKCIEFGERFASLIKK